MNKLNSALTEQASSNNAPKRVKAKEIFLGIDAHFKSNQVARKIDNGAIGPVANLSFEATALCPEATEPRRKGICRL